MADEEQEDEEETLDEDSAETTPEPEPEVPIKGIGTLVFGKWDASVVTCSDPGIAPYINLRIVGIPNTGGRHANAWFGKAKLSVVERFINGLMSGSNKNKFSTGRFSGKKMGATKAFEQALDTIAEKSGDNPLQVLVDAICNSAPMEETTRIKFGAVSQPKAVDTAPSRRLDTALRNLTTGCVKGTRKSKRTLTQSIALEVTKAASGDATSYAVSKREEVERVAASAR